jgi:hypothetical protein
MIRVLCLEGRHLAHPIITDRPWPNPALGQTCPGIFTRVLVEMRRSVSWPGKKSRIVGPLSFPKTADWAVKRPCHRPPRGPGPPRPVGPNAAAGNGPVRMVNSVCLSCSLRMGARLAWSIQISLKPTRFASIPRYLLEAWAAPSGRTRRLNAERARQQLIGAFAQPMVVNHRGDHEFIGSRRLDQGGKPLAQGCRTADPES